MRTDILIIGAGASGLMAAYQAAKTLVSNSSTKSVTLIEKMPRAGRKIMITGKGRCNFTNLKEWNEFSSHIRSNSNIVKSAFYTLPPAALQAFFEEFGMKTVVERGDRAFPASYHSTDVVDTLVNACYSKGVKIIFDAAVQNITKIETKNSTQIDNNDTETKTSTTTETTTGTIETKQNTNNTLTEAQTNNTIPETNGTANTNNNTVTDTNKNDTTKPDTTKPANTDSFCVELENGDQITSAKLIIATGGLSYPTTGSSGDGYKWAEALNHKTTPLFPSLTALVPLAYKLTESKNLHIDRSTALSELGTKLCGIKLKNINLSLEIDGKVTDSEFGDIDFTDGGIEGPVGFALSRKAVKSMINGSKIAYILDTKPGVSLTEFTTRIHELWTEIDKDPRSKRLREKERCRILLGKLIPWELIPAFSQMHPDILTLERKSRTETKVWVNLNTIAKALKAWRFTLVGYVGYERCVVTAGGISSDGIVPKTLESRIHPGLYFCGEILDIDADTGGYNLQLAFCTGALAGISAAK